MTKKTNSNLYRQLVYCCILMLPFSWVVIPRAGSAYRIFAIITILVFLFLTQGHIKIDKENKKHFWNWTLFLVWTSASFTWSNNISTSITVSIGYALIYLLAIVIMASINYVDNESLDRVWLIMGIMWIALYLLTAKAKFTSSSRTTLVILGNETDNNEFAGTFIVPTSLMVYKILHGKDKRLSIFYISCIALILYIVLMTGSRGALLALAIGIVATVLTSAKLSLKHYITIAAIILIMVTVIDAYIIPMIPRDIIMRFSYDELYYGREGRTSKWIAAFNIFKNSNVFHMLFGYGGFGVTVLNKTSTMHNQFVQILIDYGFIGFILYLKLLYASFISFWQRNRRYVGAFIGMIAMSMTITTGPAYKPFWMFLMMSFALQICNEERALA